MCVGGGPGEEAETGPGAACTALSCACWLAAQGGTMLYRVPPVSLSLLHGCIT